MGIELINSPIKEESGNILRMFRAFINAPIELQRQDSKVINVHKLHFNGKYYPALQVHEMGDLKIGDDITFLGNNLYKEGRYNIINIEFDSTDWIVYLDYKYLGNGSDKGFILFHKNWYLEVEFLGFNTNSGLYDKTLFNNSLKIRSKGNGDVEINANNVSDLLKIREWNYNEGNKNFDDWNISQKFKVQWRERYSQTKGTWQKLPDNPLMLSIFGSAVTDDIPYYFDYVDDDFLPNKELKQLHYFNGIDIYFSHLNDIDITNKKNFLVKITCYGLQKNVLLTKDLYTFENELGLVIQKIENIPENIPTDTVFIKVDIKDAEGLVGDYYSGDYNSFDYHTSQ